MMLVVIVEWCSETGFLHMSIKTVVRSHQLS